MIINIVHWIIIKLKYIFNTNVKMSKFRIPFDTKLNFSKKSIVSIGKINVYPNVNFRVRENASLIIGDGSFFNNGCIITSRNKIEIGKNVLFGPNVMIFDHNHDYKSKNMTKDFINGNIVIGDNTWIGANAIVLKDSYIGKNCVIAAGVIVSGIEIPDDSLYFGNGIIKKIKRSEKK